ncbi:NADPH-dependent 2,4-dienoyl-CoA reductase/sulfur reductase-like enzyme/rhodanese-related sulfurtransferase [Wenyingzhuangia heitensis]|uniref:NADPH-dependent 2,4-dienoyl-CoA reductase/sulfur reductase-like enzyme/rhodanese-related sulfurtransferase n=1 Tax=Wenyingzhuangia heitensis TaxID=1487859 RepID=A0ABX0U7V5_9FLAO|nr:FAD-dependent oxidoreductase [Wenyingzhuangia heitensis]NIJ44929.1 NADPH-dependent 2,4-dienoyl-CoA reductase/sulfur reductase-like enzyme/rhodanese-related sulfurtransferase [Wenyingzhuangia heitensis]
MNLDIIVIGGLSAGPSAAAKARRQNENANIKMFEKCKNISYATCGIPYALSGVIKTREKLLVVEADLLRNRFNIDVCLEEEVIEILPEEHKVITTKSTYTYDKLVFTTGAKTIVPKIINLEKATNWSPCRTLEDFDKIMQKGAIDKAEHITIMGAGLIGVEVVENLIELGKKVTLIEGGDGVLPMWSSKFRKFAQNTLEEHGVEVITNTFVKEVDVKKGKITSVLTPLKKVVTDFVIMSVGIKPNTDLLVSKGAAHLKNGALTVNEKMETSVPDIYAAGDCASIKNTLTNEHDYLPLGTHSNKGGRTAGANAAGGNENFKGGYKTAIIQVFQNTLGRTGLSLDYLKSNNYDFKVSLIVAGATPGYFPNQKDLIIEIYYDAKTGKILGCEAFGEHGVDKRVDVMSTAIYGGLTIEDLPNLDLAYAPPFSPAKDPVVVAGFVSNNSFHNDYKEISVEELQSKINKNSNIQIIDVRAKNEVESFGAIPNSINISLDIIRNSTIEMLDTSKETVVYCAKGMRGYLASLQLKHKGFTNIKNLSGGFKIWSTLYPVKE